MAHRALRLDGDQQGADGVHYNLQFDAYSDALHAWRYPDLTHHVAFLAHALDLTIEQEMRAEAQYLQRHGAARARLKSIIEGPDPALDRIIRCVRSSARRAMVVVGLIGATLLPKSLSSTNPGDASHQSR
jgi:hypothetical protein